MNILVFGAAGGSGRAITARALAAGHDVTGFVRDAAQLDAAPGLTIVTGDATNPEDMARAVAPGHDAIILALGERPGAVDWLPGLRHRQSRGLCETATRHILAALPDDAPTRLVVITAYGVGDTRILAPWYFRWYLRLFLGPLMDDKQRQEALLKASAHDVLLVQPVGLTDAPASGNCLASAEGAIRSQQVSRNDLARFIVDELQARRHLRATVAFSG